MYKYFVSFSHSNGISFGFGNTEATTDYKIDGIHAIKKVAKSIEEQLPYENVVIINFVLFDK